MTGSKTEHRGRKKKLINKIKQVFAGLLRKKTEKTKKYDQVTVKVKKILFATGTYIPELCEALKDDWYPDASYDDMIKDEAAQSEIRERILDDWSYERNQELSDMLKWSNIYIEKCFPKWLKRKYDTQGRQDTIMSKKLDNFLQLVEAQKPKLDAVAEQLPEAPEPPPKPAPKPLGELERKGLPEPSELRSEAMQAIATLWESLGGQKHNVMPTGSHDVLLDLIKPSRKFRLRLFKGINEDDAIDLYNHLHWVDMLIKDAMDMWDGMQKEKTETAKNANTI